MKKEAELSKCKQQCEPQLGAETRNNLWSCSTFSAQNLSPLNDQKTRFLKKITILSFQDKETKTP